MHISNTCNLFDFKTIKVFSPNEQHRRDFAEKMAKQLKRNIVAAGSPKETVEGSDFIQAAHRFLGCSLRWALDKKGMYVASIGGSDASNKRREIDDENYPASRCLRRYFFEGNRRGLDRFPDVWEVAQNGIKAWDSIHEIQARLGRYPSPAPTRSPCSIGRRRDRPRAL